MQTDVHGFRRKAADADREFDFETFMPVFMMSSFGLTLSLLLIALVARAG